MERRRRMKAVRGRDLGLGVLHLLRHQHRCEPNSVLWVVVTGLLSVALLLFSSTPPPCSTSLLLLHSPISPLIPCCSQCSAAPRPEGFKNTSAARAALQNLIVIAAAQTPVPDPATNTCTTHTHTVLYVHMYLQLPIHELHKHEV